MRTVIYQILDSKNKVVKETVSYLEAKGKPHKIKLVEKRS